MGLPPDWRGPAAASLDEAPREPRQWAELPSQRGHWQRVAECPPLRKAIRMNRFAPALDRVDDVGSKHVESEDNCKIAFPDRKFMNFSEPGFLERFKRRDPDTIGELVEAYLPQLLRAGRGMGFSREENEDLAQSVFTTLLEKAERFEGRSHIRTYLFGIFYNKVSEHLREKRRERETDPIEETIESRFDARGSWSQPPVDVETEVFAREANKIIQGCLDSLPRAQRIAYYLREVEELSTPDICKELGITATNLGVLLYRGRNRLRECVEERGLKRG
jgi:RNA polymerase sigma-70 factor, ECF subfamily